MQEQIIKVGQDEEQLKQLNTQLENRAKKFNSQFTPLTLAQFKLFKIKKASQTGSVKYLEGLVLNDIQDMRQRKKVINQRTKKFFQNIQVQKDPNKFFSQRSVPDFSQEDLKIRDNVWYLFGVDYMSNERIRHYFNVNPHFKIQWINDSSCNIVYNSSEQALDAVKPFFKGESMKDQNQQIWYELQQYEVEGVMRKLFCRLATNRDIKKQTIHGHQSKFYRWVINKQKINSFVKTAAKKQIRNKTKRIAKQNKPDTIKKQQQENDSSSSSGVSMSDQKHHQKNENEQ